NDAHIFCREDQVGAEIASVLAMVRRAHEALGFRADAYRLSLRGSGSKYVGADELWRQAEALLRDALAQAGVEFAVAEGEAAFYGPKIDIQVFDYAGREATLATIQIDLYQPRQFGLSYRDADGSEQHPVIVHRSIV